MTKRMLRLVGFVLLAACGDDGGDGVSSGLPADAKLSSLDAGDAQKLCMSMADSFNNMLSDDEVKKITCVVAAAPLSVTLGSDGMPKGDVAKCKMLVSKCMNGESIGGSGEPAFEVEEEFVDEAACEGDNLTSNFDSCEANVGEFESCANGMLSALSARFDVFDCESLRDPEKFTNMDSEGLDLESNPRCEALYDKCPNIDFGTTEEDDIEE